MRASNARPEAAARHGRTTEATVLRNLSAPHPVHVGAPCSSHSVHAVGACSIQTSARLGGFLHEMSPATSLPRAAPTRDFDGRAANRNSQRTKGAPGRLAGLQPKPENGADRSRPRKGRIASVPGPRRDPKMGHFMSCLRRTTPPLKASPAYMSVRQLVRLRTGVRGAAAAGSNRLKRGGGEEGLSSSAATPSLSHQADWGRGLTSATGTSGGKIRITDGYRSGLGLIAQWGKATAASSPSRNLGIQIARCAGADAEEGKQKIRSQGSMLPKHGQGNVQDMNAAGRQPGGVDTGWTGQSGGQQPSQWVDNRATGRVSKRPSHGAMERPGGGPTLVPRRRNCEMRERADQFRDPGS